MFGEAHVSSSSPSLAVVRRNSPSGNASQLPSSVIVFAVAIARPLPFSSVTHRQFACRRGFIKISWDAH